MSQWRREACERLPELHRILASPLVEGPMALWIELNQEFERRCESDPPPVDLLKRIWEYSQWCLKHPSGDVQTAAALGFCEHLIDTPRRIEVLPKILNRSDFLKLRPLLEYHHTPEHMDHCLKLLWG